MFYYVRLQHFHILCMSRKIDQNDKKRLSRGCKGFFLHCAIICGEFEESCAENDEKISNARGFE